MYAGLETPKLATSASVEVAISCLQYVLVTLNAGKSVMFGGTEAPAAYGELLSIGAIGGEKNKTVSDIILLAYTTKYACIVCL